ASMTLGAHRSATFCAVARTVTDFGAIEKKIVSSDKRALTPSTVGAGTTGFGAATPATEAWRVARATISSRVARAKTTSLRAAGAATPSVAAPARTSLPKGSRAAT